jgi:hypothetical protein
MKTFTQYLDETLDIAIPPHPGSKWSEPQPRTIYPEGGVGKPNEEKKLIELFIKLRPGGELEGEPIDLCSFHLGKNLFCEKALPIPRLNMPQLASGDKSLADYFYEWCKTETDVVTPDFSRFGNLKKQRDIDMSETNVKLTPVPAADLKATQLQINGSKVSGMVQSLIGSNFKPDAKTKNLFAPIVVSRDLYIVDGHHRWAALVVADIINEKSESPIKFKVYKINLDIVDILGLGYPDGAFDKWLQANHHMSVNAPMGM